MPLVVDAYNVLHVTGVLPPEIAGLDLNGLADLIEASAIGPDEVWIVCDGMKSETKQPRRRNRVWFSWAGAGAKADDLIIQLVQRSSSPRRMTVVTADRAVQRSVKRRGATVLTSEEFLERLAADWRAGHPRSAAAVAKRVPSPRETLPLAAPEVRVWLRIFGLDEEMRELGPSEAAKAERTPKAAQASKATPPAATGPLSASGKGAAPKRVEATDDPLELAGIDLASLLAGAPPPRDGARAPRRSRRDRR